MTPDELTQLIRDYGNGVDIGYNIQHVHGELLFRDMMQQWQDDSDDLEEDERINDKGCGHDQNDNYGKED